MLVGELVVAVTYPSDDAVAGRTGRVVTPIGLAIRDEAVGVMAGYHVAIAARFQVFVAVQM